MFSFQPRVSVAFATFTLGFAVLRFQRSKKPSWLCGACLAGFSRF
jgi:hypothetical protein